MPRWASFQPHVGWSDVLSALALIVSGLALWQSIAANNAANAPRLSIAPLVTQSSIACSKPPSQFNTLQLATVRVTNGGGRSATLLRLHSRGGGQSAIIGLGSDGSRRSVPAVLFVVDSLAVIKSYDPPSWVLDSLLPTSRRLEVDEDRVIRSYPTILDIPIGPGESKLLPLAFRSVFSDSGGQILAYEMALSAEFADGSTVPLTVTLPGARARGWICQKPPF